MLIAEKIVFGEDDEGETGLSKVDIALRRYYVMKRKGWDVNLNVRQGRKS